VEGYKDYYVKKAVSGAKNSALSTVLCKASSLRREIATNLGRRQVTGCGEEFDSTPTPKTDMGGRLYHAGAHSPVSGQTHFTSKTIGELVIGVNVDGL
jgi:hypothetical protein